MNQANGNSAQNGVNSGEKSGSIMSSGSPTVPDGSGRVVGTSYPIDVAPAGSAPLFEKQPEGVRDFTLLRPEDGDIVVVRTSLGFPPEEKALLNRQIQATFPGRKLVVLFLPEQCLVHLEPSKLKNEDRGYRETKVYGTDTPDANQAVSMANNQDDRGVFTGVSDLPPQIPVRGVSPHPESVEQGHSFSKKTKSLTVVAPQEDPCSG